MSNKFEERCTKKDAKRVIWLQRRIQRLVEVHEVRKNVFQVSLEREGGRLSLAEYGDGTGQGDARGAAEIYRRVFVQGTARAVAGISFYIPRGKENPIAALQQRVWQADHQPPAKQVIEEFFEKEFEQ